MSQPYGPGPQHPPRDGDGEGARVWRVETTTPVWRLVSVAAACGAVAVLAYYLNAVHHAGDFATVAVITAGYTVSFWAAKRPREFAGRFGPFGKIAAAVRESQDDLRAWVLAKPLKAGAMIAACYGIAVVLAKHLVLIVIAGLWNPWLAVAVGAGIGAVVAAPHMFARLTRRLLGPRPQPQEGQGRSSPPPAAGRGH